MAGARVELYTDGDLDRLRKKIMAWTAAAAVVGLGGLAACVAMAALTTTATAGKMELGAVLTSTLAGWFVLYVWIFVILPARRDLAHGQMLREEEPERVEGTVALTGERVPIRRSITARRVEVRRGEDVRRFLVSESRAEKFAGANLSAVYVVHGYVAALEAEP